MIASGVLPPSSRGCPRPSCTSTTSAPPRPRSCPAGGAPPRHGADRSRGLAEYFRFTDFAHFITVYLSVVDLIATGEDVRLLTYEVARDMAAAEHPVRRADRHPVHLGDPRHPGGGLRGGDRGRPGGRRGRFRHRAALDLRHSRRARAWPAPRHRWRSPSTTARRRWSASGSAGPRSACRGRSSSRTSTGPAPPACTACRTPARPPARRRSGTRSASWAPSASATAPRAAADPALLAHLAEHRIPLEVCPTSNMATRAVPDSTSTRCKNFVAPACVVTINSDDPPMFAHRPQQRVRGGRPAARPRRARRGRTRQERGRGRPSWTRPGRPGSSPRSTPTPPDIRTNRWLGASPRRGDRSQLHSCGAGDSSDVLS